MPFSDYNVALVTGASAGMGEAIVERLCREGITVHAVARRREQLAALAERTGCIPHAVDVADLHALTELCCDLKVDILVNNAGVSHPGSILNADENVIDTQVDVNLRAVLHLCRLLVPGMVSRDCGHVINITSIAAIYNFNGNSVYHATKAGVHALSRQLRVDCYGKRVRVTEICPGRVATDIFGNVSGDYEEARKRFIEGFELPQAQDIADCVAFALSAPIAVNIGNIEITPTLQVPGGLSTMRPGDSIA
ncbi:probable short-chain dehydrogenase [Pectobacterium atrosepticum SCRI1043]|uniref:Probable short-chain dehydrogenase n=1 Tax=Pectobacterium atrosepticum (strain SCRI 1043 / ATCC BAA-672) TaxID=218491 RepID=Q6CYM6_PECAS|nr:SDR family oxidoreductase [Pectobacterium atrosepticum]GKV87922.1 oxidoreductase [Pectobacterium carotovorum subsp. carotovorum]ATY92900.1 NAD(P)-dependent oxidoreductase [Pectobacterium atrosepticum]KFX17487.1 oxidoreductase [Pectobacterium atrosepticum]KMK82164.1 short-chain dehydrogenase [Pectobacterium atrosepticum ICMP 1526]MBL0895025.1 SDR family oxidoreductase [Pectobacterium atrosepticum]